MDSNLAKIGKQREKRETELKKAQKYTDHHQQVSSPLDRTEEMGANSFVAIPISNKTLLIVTSARLASIDRWTGQDGKR